MFKKIIKIASGASDKTLEDCLSCSKEGDCTCILSLDADDDTRTRLMSMGLAKGVELEVLRNRGGDVIIKSDAGSFSLGSDVAEKIRVQ